MAIYDTMQYVKPNISTVCIGLAASMGATLLASGEKGKRFALPNSQVLLHQVAGGVTGEAVEIEITAKQIVKIKEKLNTILAKHTGQPLDKISKDTDRDFYLTAQDHPGFFIKENLFNFELAEFDHIDFGFEHAGKKGFDVFN